MGWVGIYSNKQVKVAEEKGLYMIKSFRVYFLVLQELTTGSLANQANITLTCAYTQTSK